jgi:GMP reductase
MKIVDELKLDFDDVLIKPKRSSLSTRSNVHLNRDFIFRHSPRKLRCIPLIAANMDTTGSMMMARQLTKEGGLVALHKHYHPDEYINFYMKAHSLEYPASHSFFSIGTKDKDMLRLVKVFEALDEYPNICVDVANGYSEGFVQKLAEIRQQYPKSIIMAGNVVSPEMTEELILHGKVDIVKIGIGSGSVCTTRLKTGVGYPQLSAVMECAAAAHGLGGHVCSDGGCKTPADVCKAFGANSDFVMLGSMLAGTDCCEGKWNLEYFQKTIKDNKITEEWVSEDPGFETKTRKKSLVFYGMSSKTAQDKHNGGLSAYRTSEGRTVVIPYKGSTEEVMSDICGGLRSCGTYIGADCIKDFGKKTIFIKVKNTHNRIYE